MLQKNNSAQSESTRLSELEEAIRQLRLEKTWVKYWFKGWTQLILRSYVSELETEKADNSRKVELLEHDIRQALDRVQDLESDNEVLTKVKEDNAAKQTQIHRLQARMSADRVAHEQGFVSYTIIH